MTRSDPPSQPRNRELELEVESELVAHLVRQAPTGFVTGVLTVGAVLWVLWDAAPRTSLLLWLAAMCMLTLPALVVVWRFGRAPRDPEQVATWRRALTGGYGLAGAGWGSAALLLYPNVAMPFQLFLLFVLGGSGVGGMVALAPVRGAYLAYLTATYLPVIGALLAGGSLSSVATGLLLLTFWAASIVLASEFRALLVRSVALRFENRELISGLSQAKDAAEAASRAKSHLLANVSHELRTPLALILGPVRKLLGASEGAGALRRDLATVERNAQALLKHVNDLLDVARLDAGRMELDLSELDLADATRRIASLFELAAKEREIELRVETPETLPLTVDPGRIERVLLNLLSNALKFVPAGGRVHVSLRAERDEVVLSVEDNGPGVPVALREAIFERFRRGDDDGARRVGGTGLGLAIARDLVALHGGRIEVGDGAEGGALFRVRLPRASCARGAGAGTRPDRTPLDEVARQTVEELRTRAEPAPAADEGGAQGLVLVLEDNPEMSRFLADCLASDYRVVTARDGRRGLEQALALKPDLILSDVMMPVMAGDALVRELRARPELEAIPIIVLTAKADDELRVRLLREGAQDFLTKPVAVEELRARVANFVMQKRARDVLQRALSSQTSDLAKLAGELASANRAKDEFLAVLSHELRTPLTPILSWSLLLQRQQLDAPSSARALEAIERCARLQVRIVEDLLDVSRAMTGKLRLNVQPIALEPVIELALDAARPAAEAKGVALEPRLDPDAGLVAGDADRLQQVIWNLLSNAIKFTPQGGRVEIRLERLGAELRLRVSDDGCGIDPALLPRLFERFWQADSSTTRTQGGLGLGLAVVRHLVELHGGTVHAESRGEGQGASFSVTLAALSGEARPIAAKAPAQSPSLRGLRVLIVDDDPDTCEIVGTIIGRAGAEVRTCRSASQALGAMDSWLPHLLVSDIAMPGEDGYALIRKVRARRSEQGGQVPAVALTAYGRSEDRAKALSAGFQVHLGKPIEPEDLVAVVASLAARGALAAH